MTYLVDANVLSEPTKARPDSNVVAWLTAHEGDFVVDSIVLGELSFGILALPKRAQARPARRVVQGGRGCHRMFTVGCRRRSPLG
jgi:predicted nucleic acid-binding protein